MLLGLPFISAGSNNDLSAHAFSHAYAETEIAPTTAMQRNVRRPRSKCMMTSWPFERPSLSLVLPERFVPFGHYHCLLALASNWRARRLETLASARTRSLGFDARDTATSNFEIA